MLIETIFIENVTKINMTLSIYRMKSRVKYNILCVAVG